MGNKLVIASQDVDLAGGDFRPRRYPSGGVYVGEAVTVTGVLAGDREATSWSLSPGTIHPLAFATITSLDPPRAVVRVLY